MDIFGGIGCKKGYILNKILYMFKKGGIDIRCYLFWISLK